MSTTSSLFADTPTPSASVPLIIMSTTNLTTDKKRDHLFDVDRTLEIPVKDFNDKWWPLVSNIWMKWDSNLVEIEAAKNYSPSAITSAIKKYVTLELGLGECMCKLRRKEVANIKYKVRGPTETHLIGNVDLRLDISESIFFLTE
ncbi:hypothetical protein RclHR1_01530013 [Rhizophagus clarus]|uniref:Uncharacterized protein n=1 Tax=Rhizophagus clarus TaxID=94130 RepID=A0A2Z6QGJ7_9GLOM|nr:hypothetical protein RclHR1_01530013 [Rhizophagus clarus]GET04709.1 hypothetical protein GLOIN_2v1767162 [Rhizophagus clarus]